MAWGAKDSATTLSSIGATYSYFDDTPALNPGESAHVQVSVDFPTTPTDDAIVAVFTTLDASTEDWDEIPFMTFLIDNAEDTSDVSFIVSGVYKFRVGVKRTGTTDTLSADMSHRVNGISA